MEVPQGFSLGINQRFYPYCTSRECTPAQGILDLGVPPSWLKKSIVCLRTYPIRTGSLPEGSSGGCYEDQEEITWESIGQEPEISTTSNRKRRLFSWSWIQWEDMIRATEPDAIFLNFCNYMSNRGDMYDFVETLHITYKNILGRDPDFVVLGYMVLLPII